MSTSLVLQLGRAAYVRLILLTLAVLAGQLLLGPSVASAQVTTDYLVQMVCVDANNQPIYGDPYTCTNKRKLAVGESLPYHKTDYLGLQISDSFPIKDTAGVSRAVQTYFFTQELNTDPLFPNMVHYNPIPNDGGSGGYNIVGADASHVFFRGTADGSAFWQPWFTPACAAAGWILLPNSGAPISYGGTNSPTANVPNCSGSLPFYNASTVEWNSFTSYPYASGKSIPTLYEFHYAAGYDSFEVNYFTQIYGVTRWEAWLSSSLASGPGQAAMQNCPGSTYTAFLHNKTMYMQDCRDWTTIVQPAAPWSPAGVSPVDPLVQTWPVDPLYNSANLLKNTHIGGNTLNPATCGLGPWTRSYPSAPYVLNWAFVSPGVPFTGPANYTCILQFSTPGAPNGQVIYQQQNVSNLSGNYSYGVMLWSPGPPGTVSVNIIERDGNGALTGSAAFAANTSTLPHVFASTIQLNPATKVIYFAMYPQTPNAEFNFTGAWIAKVP